MVVELDTLRVMVFAQKETLTKMKASKGLRVDFKKIKRNRRLVFF